MIAKKVIPTPVHIDSKDPELSVADAMQFQLPH